MQKKKLSGNIANRWSKNRLIRTVLSVLIVLLVLTPVTAFAASKGGGASSKATSWFSAFLLTGGPVGLFIIWSLVLLSAVSIGFSIHQALFYRKKQLIPEEFHQSIDEALKAKEFSKAIGLAKEENSLLGRLVAAALKEASHGYGAMERAIEEAGDLEVARMLRPVEYLNLTGNVSPMMGLFGTVYGMIVAFQSLVAAGGSPNPAKLAGGISTALVTTFWGLVVAIPALAAYSIIRGKIDALTTEALLQAEEIIEPFKPSGRSKKSKSKSKSSSSSSQPKPNPDSSPKEEASSKRPATPSAS